MPLYEYKCNSCGSVFEVIQKFSDEPLTTHPQCGGAVERLLSAPGLQFKGSGWYITDYARSGSGKDKGPNGKSSEPAAKTSGETPASPASSSSPSGSETK